MKKAKPKRRRCTFCGRLRPRRSVMPDPQYPDVVICKERQACVDSIPSKF